MSGSGPGPVEEDSMLPEEAERWPGLGSAECVSETG